MLTANMDTKYTVLYLLIVGISGLFLLWWFRKRIFQIEKRRKSRVTKIKRFDAIKTSSPADEPVVDAREAAVDSIETRFSIIRKLSFLSITIIWLVTLIFPFLDRLPATLVSISVAASGIIIGVAARPFIENLISGVVISFSRSIRLGDTVIIDNKYGSVEDITVTHTVIKIWNWRRYIVPNSRMLSKEIINCTINDAYQWMHVEFYVSYDSDIDLVKKLAIRAASSGTYFAAYEDPRFWVMDMEKEGYKCWIAAWSDSPTQAWELGNEIRTELIRQFKANGIKTHGFVFNSLPPKTELL